MRKKREDFLFPVCYNGIVKFGTNRKAPIESHLTTIYNHRRSRSLQWLPLTGVSEAQSRE